MFSCWNEDPNLRPSFDELGNSISECIDQTMTQRFIELNKLFSEANSRNIESGHVDYIGKMSNGDYQAAPPNLFQQSRNKSSLSNYLPLKPLKCFNCTST